MGQSTRKRQRKTTFEEEDCFLHCGDYFCTNNEDDNGSSIVVPETPHPVPRETDNYDDNGNKEDEQSQALLGQRNGEEVM